MVHLLLAAVGCVHQVSWQVQPSPSYTLPSLEVSVVAADRACKRVADELVDELGARPGVRVRPGAELQLQVRACDEGSDITVEVRDQYVAGVRGDLVEAERRYHRRAWATSELVVSGPTPSVTLLGSAERTDRGQWEGGEDNEIPALITLREGLRRDLARDLADQVAPLPETLRRMVWRDPQPGTARELHNAAVDAERTGDLQRAMDLALQAYAANPNRGEMLYIEDLERHAEAVGYALIEGADRR